MSQREVAIVGQNNTRAAVTGQEELLVKVNAITSTSGIATEATLAIIQASTASVAITPTFKREIGPGTVDVKCYSFSISNVGAANGVFLGATIKPGETFNFDAGALNNAYPAYTFSYDGAGTELIVIYNT